MAYLRSIKNQNILSSDERTNYLKDKTLFISNKYNKSNGIIFVDNSGCLKATNSYKTRYSIAKGHNLVATDCNFKINSINPVITGSINEANFIVAKMPNPKNNPIIADTPTTPNAELNGNIYGPNYTTSTINNLINENDPLSNPTTASLSDYTKWDSSGVMIDPNNIFINKNICGPLIYLKDPSGNQYYDISQNSGSTKEFIQMLKNNSRLTNFYLSSNINFNKK